MFYCEKCHLFSHDTTCKNCGIINLREVKEDDFCYLTTVDEFFGKMVIDTMKNNDIQCLFIPVGDGVRSQFALSLGNYQLYVMYKNYQDAVEIIDFYTANNPTIKLKEEILQNEDKWHFESFKVEKKIRKKLKFTQETDIMQCVKDIVENAVSIRDMGVMSDNEHGLRVTSENVVLWFSAKSFKINI